MRTRGRSWRTGSITARTGIAAVIVAALTALGVVAATRAPAAVAPKAPAAHGTLAISKAFFGKTVEPYTGMKESTFIYTLTNTKGMKVQVLSYGAITRSIWLPGRNGHSANVVLGFKTLQDYVKEDSPPVTANGGPYFGETVGRYANRIAKGTFMLNGKTYTLPINNGVNALHGGLNGFGNHIWHQIALFATKSRVGVTLRLVSPDGDEGAPKTSPGCGGFTDGCTGYPAQITVDVTFALNNANQFSIHYRVHNDSKTLSTVQNLTNHSYFNLAGEGSAAGSAYNQFLMINANRYSPTDDTQIPLPLAHGVAVAGTPFDFRSAHTIGSRISDVSANDNTPARFAPATGGKSQLLIAQGYDHNWILNTRTAKTTGPGGLNLAARALDTQSGRALTVWTDQPGVQFYSGNFLNGTLVGISGHTYRQGAGYTFETQHFPDSPNQPEFPSTALGPNGTFTSTTIFAFSSNGL